MTATSQQRRDCRSWKDSPKAKTIARAILLSIVGLIAILAFACLSMLKRYAAAGFQI
jgi:hypothetical protein